MLEKTIIEILIFLKFLLNFIILKHLNYLSRIQNRNPNYFFEISFKFYNFITITLLLKNP